MASRRDVLKKLGLGLTAITVTTGAAIQGSTCSAFASGSSLDGSPWWLLAPLTVGTVVGKGWQVSTLGSIENGASILTLQHKQGQTVNIHICAYDGDPKGLAHTEFLDLILMDGGCGDKPTDEHLGRVLMGIAKRIRKNELSLQQDLDALVQLQTHEERVLKYGAENLV
jgi:hypothetical protein